MHEKRVFDDVNLNWRATLSRALESPEASTFIAATFLLLAFVYALVHVLFPGSEEDTIEKKEWRAKLNARDELRRIENATKAELDLTTAVSNAMEFCKRVALIQRGYTVSAVMSPIGRIELNNPQAFHSTLAIRRAIVAACVNAEITTGIVSPRSTPLAHTAQAASATNDDNSEGRAEEEEEEAKRLLLFRLSAQAKEAHVERQGQVKQHSKTALDALTRQWKKHTARIDALVESSKSLLEAPMASANLAPLKEFALHLKNLQAGLCAAMDNPSILPGLRDEFEKLSRNAETIWPSLAKHQPTTTSPRSLASHSPREIESYSPAAIQDPPSSSAPSTSTAKSYMQSEEDEQLPNTLVNELESVLKLKV